MAHKQTATSSPTKDENWVSQSIILASSPASWARFAPGPSPGFQIKGLPPKGLRVGVVACGCTCLMLSGINVALMGSVSSTTSYLKRVGLEDGKGNTELLIGLINAIYWVGVIIGALLIGPISDQIGRRRAIVCAGIYGIAVIPIFAALQTFTWALCLRFLNGLATGAFDSVGLNWSAEASEARTRGRSIGLQMCCAALGASQSYFLVYGLSKHTDGELIWRLPIAYQCIFVLVVSFAVWFLPESPRWLVRVGLVEETREALIDMTADRGDTVFVTEGASREIAAIQAALEEELANNSSTTYMAMLFSADEYKTRRRTWSALFVQFATQAMIGTGVVTGYSIKIFQTGGWSSDLAALLSGAGIVVQAAFGLPGAYYADKIGRRNAFIYGALVGAILLAFVGMCGHFVARNADHDPARTKAFGSAVVTLVMVWSAQLGMTWLWAPFAYPSEIFPSRCRAKGSSIGIVGLALGSFFTNMVSPYLFAAIGYKAMFLFCGLSILAAIISYLWLPETAMKTLEEIDHIYD